MTIENVLSDPESELVSEAVKRSSAGSYLRAFPGESPPNYSPRGTKKPENFLHRFYAPIGRFLGDYLSKLVRYSLD